MDTVIPISFGVGFYPVINSSLEFENHFCSIKEFQRNQSSDFDRLKCRKGAVVNYVYKSRLENNTIRDASGKNCHQSKKFYLQ